MSEVQTQTSVKRGGRLDGGDVAKPWTGDDAFFDLVTEIDDVVAVDEQIELGSAGGEPFLQAQVQRARVHESRIAVGIGAHELRPLRRLERARGPGHDRHTRKWLSVLI